MNDVQIANWLNDSGIKTHTNKKFTNSHVHGILKRFSERDERYQQIRNKKYKSRLSKMKFIFNASKTSPDPHLEDTALFPCFATLIPILASNNADAVEIFSVFIPSPPVPQVSIQLSTVTLLDLFLKT